MAPRTRLPGPPSIDLDALRIGLARAGMDDAVAGWTCTYVGRFSNDVWRLDLDNGVRLAAKQAYRGLRAHDPPDAERTFYRFLGTAAELPVLRFVGDLDGVLILEWLDLASFSFETGATPDHATAALDALAHWHAHWWERPPRAGWLPDLADPVLCRQVQRNYDTAWTACRERLLVHAPEFETLGDALVGRLAEPLAALGRPATFIHGDAHAENIPLAGDRAVLLDWQEPRIGNPGYDLAVFTTMSFPGKQRRAQERALVTAHADRLAELGCLWPDPWDDYRLGLVRRAARIVEIADTGFASLPWVFRRSAMAAIETHAGELIR